MSLVLDAVAARLPECRAKWWAVHGSTGLEGRWAEVSVAGALRLPLRRPRQARRVVRAGYDAGMGMLTLALDDGTGHRVAAGQGIEEAEEWA